MSATQTQIECPMEPSEVNPERHDCERTLRVRDHGDAHVWPRRATETDTLRPAGEVEQCVAIKKSDGERCENSASEGGRTCGQHGSTLAEAARRSHLISTAAYGAAPALSPEGRPYVGMVERNRPRGHEYECPVHGVVSPELD